MNSVESEILIKNWVDSISHHSGFHFVFFFRQYLQLDVGVTEYEDIIYYILLIFSHLKLSSESLEGRFIHLLMDTISALFSKLYFIVKKSFPRDSFSSLSSLILVTDI